MISSEVDCGFKPAIGQNCPPLLLSFNCKIKRNVILSSVENEVWRPDYAYVPQMQFQFHSLYWAWAEADVWKPVHIKPELSAWLDNTKGKWENGFSLLFGSAGCLIRGQRVQAGSPSMTLNVGLFFSLQPMKPHYMLHSNTAIIIMPFKSSTNAHQRLH